ncbi:MAG: hypothetical protein NTU44_16780 [Bacteroidetes bacterium]|nr:hypothetical protein [Bacteroidota bacterium]
MKAVIHKIHKKKPKSWVTPDTNLLKEEFSQGIREAEKGPFTSIQESMEYFEQWLQAREKK